MGLQNFPVLAIATDNGTQTTGVSGAGNIAIPTMEGGTKPKYVYIASYSATVTDVIYVSPQLSATNGAAATGFPLPVQSGNAIILNVTGYSHIGYDGNGDFTVYPLEDF